MVPLHDHDNLGGSNRLISMDAAAQLLDIPRRRLKDNWRAWELQGYKIGREIKFRERDINAWLAKRAA